MLTVFTVIGTRPEAIKLAPVVAELQRYPSRIRSVVCVTAQHRDMMDQALDLFAIRPDYDLNIMQPEQALSQLTSTLLSRLDAVVDAVKPDWIVAQGDTTTVMVSALVSFYRGIRFGHVEAGLRTGDSRNPFPEEVNRRIADSLAELMFAPTERARQVLLKEGHPEDKVILTGNTVIDALMAVVSRPYNGADDPLANLPGDATVVLVTAHRRESFGAPLREICYAVRELADLFASQGVHFIYPVHRNPNVQRAAQEVLSDVRNVVLTEPLNYLSLVHVARRSTLILTDSGGIQEEAPSLGVPVLVMRDTTERPEAVEVGVAKVVGTARTRIVKEAARLLTNPTARAAMRTPVNPYGDGKASERIVSALLERSRG